MNGHVINNDVIIGNDIIVYVIVFITTIHCQWSQIPRVVPSLASKSLWWSDPMRLKGFRGYVKLHPVFYTRNLSFTWALFCYFRKWQNLASMFLSKFSYRKYRVYVLVTSNSIFRLGMHAFFRSIQTTGNDNTENATGETLVQNKDLPSFMLGNLFLPNFSSLMLCKSSLYSKNINGLAPEFHQSRLQWNVKPLTQNKVH